MTSTIQESTSTLHHAFLRQEIESGIASGNAGTIDAAYSVLAENALIERGASDKDIAALRKAYCHSDYLKIDEVCQRYGLREGEYKPTKFEAVTALKSAAESGREYAAECLLKRLSNKNE